MARQRTPTRRKTERHGHKVGPGHPPKDKQFKRGVSGNPKGRPRGSRNLSTLIMEAANSTVTATIGGKPRKISKIHATAMQLATKAASGNPAAMSKFLDWFDEIETRAAANRPNQFQLEIADVEVLRALYRRMLQCLPVNIGAPA